MKNRCNINNMGLNIGYYMQLPKILFSKEFKDINSDAKVVYALLKDRYQISAYKKFTNKQGDIVVIYPREKIAEMLNISIPTVRKAMKKLAEMGLIEEERQGLNKPNLIYLLNLEKEDIVNDDWDIEYGEMYEEIKFKEDIDIKVLEKQEVVSDNKIQESTEDEKIINFQEIQDISDSKNLSLQEVKNKYFYSKRENNLLSGEKNSFSQEEKNVSPSIINKSLINISLNNLSNQYIDMIEKIKTQIDYSVLKSKDNNKKYLNLIVDIMADINCSTEDIVIGKILRPIEIAKNRISSLNQFHIEYVIECLEESNIEIQNMKQYILTALFNAPSTMEFYYSNKIKTMLG